MQSTVRPSNMRSLRTWRRVAFALESDSLTVHHTLVDGHFEHLSCLLLVVPVPSAIHDVSRGVLFVARCLNGDFQRLPQIQVLKADRERVHELLGLAGTRGCGLTHAHGFEDVPWTIAATATF